MSTTAASGVSCLLIDDHPAMIDAISRALDGAGVRIVGSATSGAKGLELLERRPADVAVVDLKLPDTDGIALAQEIARSGSHARTVLYSDHADPRLAGRALAAGVSGLITKGSPVSEVVRAVKAVAAGGTYVDPLLGGPLALQDRRPTLRERDVLLLERLSFGFTDQKIGEEIHLSTETVRANIRGVVRALGARNRAHAVAIALKTGLIR
jgi:DNA-binding NarL/FixJ family response regulator